MIKRVSNPLRLDVDDTWDKDPDIMLGDDIKENELLEGRVIRKNVCPAPVFAPKKRRFETVSHAPSDSEKDAEDKSMEANKDTSSVSAGHETLEVMNDSQG